MKKYRIEISSDCGKTWAPQSADNCAMEIDRTALIKYKEGLSVRIFDNEKVGLGPVEEYLQN